MIELKGKFNSAKVFTDNIDNTTISQVIQLCNQEFVKDSKIRIMPDCHAGAGCVIGTTMTLTDKVVPNLVGVDIGCGMEVIRIAESSIDVKKLDEVIHMHIPSGFAVRSTPHASADRISFGRIHADIDVARSQKAIGTLGGGNHFIELDVDDDGNYYLVIHSGSRNMGKRIAEFWQEKAYLTLKEDSNETPSKALAYLYGKNFSDYISDMKIAQEYAFINRAVMGDIIVEKMGLTDAYRFTTIHNYIDIKNMILRKGAVSAVANEKVIIPINMRDGSLIAFGKGNPDWNYSAPHGAGRIMARGEAKRTLSMDAFKESMEGIYTTTANQSTLDESPMAYKNMDEIIENTKDTIQVVKIIKPVYNYKDAED